MTKEPETPWLQGINQEYAMFRLEVDICVTRDQEVYSIHRPQGQVDMDTMKSLYSYGEQQTIFGLLTETLRRETFFEILLRMSDDPNFMESYIKQDEEGKSVIENEVSEDVIELIYRTVEKMAPDVARDVLTMMDQKQKGISTPRIKEVEELLTNQKDERNECLPDNE